MILLCTPIDDNTVMNECVSTYRRAMTHKFKTRLIIVAWQMNKIEFYSQASDGVDCTHKVRVHYYATYINESGNNKGDGGCVATNYIVVIIIK